MGAPQRIDRVRRQYNQWAANQTLEDYALRFTAKSARRWSPIRVANTALGSISFLALEAIGATITLSYGFTNACAAILVVCALLMAAGAPICFYAAKFGVDIDLLTRGAGFGYLGSTVTSLIYASFTFIFFAIEAVILANGLEMCFGVPLWAGYLAAALGVIPLVTHGITFISRFQLWTQPLWAVLQILPFVAIAFLAPATYRDWGSFAGARGDPSGHFDLALFGAASAVVFALAGQIGEQVDFLRFMPRERRGKAKGMWWFSLLSAGPGWAILGALKMLAGSFLAYFSLQHGVAAASAGDPTHMYFTAFAYIVPSPQVALILTGCFVVLAQLKINVTNAYAGSIAWSNFFARLTHSHPGRVVWLVFNVTIALILMEIGVYRVLEQTLGFYANIAVAWVGALVADLAVNKPLGLSPKTIEFKRAHLYDLNPVGIGAVMLSFAVSTAASTGLVGGTARALAPYVALATAFVASISIAWLTRGRYYLARSPGSPGPAVRAQIRCSVCEHGFEAEDMAHCPAYAGPICSLCCSLDARCHDLCKPHGRAEVQIGHLARRLLPRSLHARLDTQVVRYLATFAASLALIAAILALIHVQSTATTASRGGEIAAALWKVFIVLGLIIGVVAWLFVLSAQSRRSAEAEMARQAKLLMDEIEAHQRTDAALQKAKEAAEAANDAKSRYVVGLGHELRTPLNAILGYSQLLENSDAIGRKPRDQIRLVQRSARHLSGLIDGLLDIAKIEAGRLHLEREEVRFAPFVEQLAGIVRIQAQAKGIAFVVDCPGTVPEAVYTDEKRLRQILINLLSNAIKFTRHGKVTLSVRYHSPIADFEIADTGPGIAEHDLERIFEPFERGDLGQSQPNTGTGLGLTIAKLLSGVMGGRITVRSRPGEGSVFAVKLLLSEVMNPRPPAPQPARIRGYDGVRRTIMVVDDNPVHLELMAAILEPLGFIVMSAPDGPTCLTVVEHCRPDLFILDVSMPGLDGWTVARRLREAGHYDARILMLSANAVEAQRNTMAEAFHDGFLMKPIDVPKLLDTIRAALRVDWIVEDPVPEPPEAPAVDGRRALPRPQVTELRELGEIGYVRGIRCKLDEIVAHDPSRGAVVGRLRALVETFDMPGYLSELETLGDDG